MVHLRNVNNLSVDIKSLSSLTTTSEHCMKWKLKAQPITFSTSATTKVDNYERERNDGQLYKSLPRLISEKHTFNCQCLIFDAESINVGTLQSYPVKNLKAYQVIIIRHYTNSNTKT